MAGSSERLVSLLAQLERARQRGFLGPGPVRRHVEHAEGFLSALASVAGTVVDLGSGGGVPGLIIGVARPDLSLVLLEATAQRCRFLEAAVQELGLVRTQVVEGRAEIIGHGERRAGADAVVARAFGPPAATVECAAPLLRIGGVLVVSEPPEPAPHRWPPVAVARFGMRIGARSSSSPVVQVLHQVERCPTTFPRPMGRPAHRPLF